MHNLIYNGTVVSFEEVVTKKNVLSLIYRYTENNAAMEFDKSFYLLDSQE